MLHRFIILKVRTSHVTYKQHLYALCRRFYYASPTKFNLSSSPVIHVHSVPTM